MARPVTLLAGSTSPLSTPSLSWDSVGTGTEEENKKCEQASVSVDPQMNVVINFGSKCREVLNTLKSSLFKFLSDSLNYNERYLYLHDHFPEKRL